MCASFGCNPPAIQTNGAIIPGFWADIIRPTKSVCMATKSKTKSPVDPLGLNDLDLEQLNLLDDLEFDDIENPEDRAFWNEFFKIEEALSVTDDLFEPPRFTISVQNQDTGETRTYRNIRLKSTKKRIEV